MVVDEVARRYGIATWKRKDSARCRRSIRSRAHRLRQAHVVHEPLGNAGSADLILVSRATATACSWSATTWTLPFGKLRMRPQRRPRRPQRPALGHRDDRRGFSAHPRGRRAAEFDSIDHVLGPVQRGRAPRDSGDRRGGRRRRRALDRGDVEAAMRFVNGYSRLGTRLIAATRAPRLPASCRERASPSSRGRPLPCADRSRARANAPPPPDLPVMRDGVAVRIEDVRAQRGVADRDCGEIDQREQRADDRETRKRIVVAPESHAIGDHDRDRREEDDHAAFDQRDRERRSAGDAAELVRDPIVDLGLRCAGASPGLRTTRRELPEPSTAASPSARIVGADEHGSARESRLCEHCAQRRIGGGIKQARARGRRFDVRARIRPSHARRENGRGSCMRTIDACARPATEPRPR